MAIEVMYGYCSRHAIGKEQVRTKTKRERTNTEGNNGVKGEYGTLWGLLQDGKRDSDSKQDRAIGKHITVEVQYS